MQDDITAQIEQLTEPVVDDTAQRLELDVDLPADIDDLKAYLAMETTDVEEKNVALDDRDATFLAEPGLLMRLGTVGRDGFPQVTPVWYLYEDGVFPTPDGRARFAVLAAQGLAESPGLRYPFLLTTGRLRDQWHGMSRTGTVARLSGHAGAPCVQMHAGDMARQGLQEGALACVTSARASIVLPAHASAEIAPGQAFIAMHWGSDWLGGQSAAGRALAGVNALTTQVRCPISQQPALKHTAVKILKVDLPWQLCAMAWFPEDEALRARTALAGKANQAENLRGGAASLAMC